MSSPQNFRKRGFDTLPPLPEIKLPASRTTYPRFSEISANTKETFRTKSKKSPKRIGKIETFLADAQDVIEGIPGDLVSGGDTFTSLTKGNRLRGLGMILVLIGLFLFAVEFVK